MQKHSKAGEMIALVISVIAYLIENCTGVVLIEQCDNTSIQEAELVSVWDAASQLEEFTTFDPEDTIFQEFDPPTHQDSYPQGWRKSLPTFSKSFWECVKSVLLIQTVAGSLIGVAWSWDNISELYHREMVL